jgi:hypothetical protein
MMGSSAGRTGSLLLCRCFRKELSGSFDISHDAQTPHPWPKHRKITTPEFRPACAMNIDDELKRNLMSEHFRLDEGRGVSSAGALEARYARIWRSSVGG